MTRMIAFRFRLIFVYMEFLGLLLNKLIIKVIQYDFSLLEEFLLYFIHRGLVKWYDRSLQNS